MRIKYLGTKAVIVFVTLLATPVVWAALAWPEWSSASSIAENAVEQAAPPEPQVLVQQVIHRIVVVPRYTAVEATPAPGQSQLQINADVPANTPVPLPTAPPRSVPQAVVPPGPSRPEPIQQPAASGSSSGNDKGSSSSSTSAASGSSNPPADTTANSSEPAPPPSNSKTKGS